MSVAYLTDSIVQQLACPLGKTHWEVFDTHIRGLYVDVLPNGRMAFRLRWYIRVEGRSVKKTLKLGDARVISVAEARQAARLTLHKIWLGLGPQCDHLPGAGPSIADFMQEQYLPYVKTYKLSWATDGSVIRNHILPTLGSCAMGQVTVPQLARLVQSMKDRNMAPGTINKVLILLRFAYRLALRWKVEGVESNPVKEISNLRDDYKIERYLTQLQATALVQAVQNSDNPMLRYIVPFLIHTGARKREALDARWQEVDWQQKVWRIPRTKSGRVRHVPLSAGALELLQRLQSEQAVPVLGDAFIFPNPKTQRPFVSIYYSWHTARLQAGLPDLRVHDLRHSFASFLINAGRSLYEVQELLGHADIKTTSRYAHLSRERLFDAVATIAPLGGWSS